MRPDLYRVILPVRDIERVAAFYTALLEVEGERVSPGRHYFDLGGTILAVYDPVEDGDDAGDWSHHENQYVYFAVDDVDATFARARELGATLVSERVESMPWGERIFYAHDPAGNPISFVARETVFRGGGE